MTKIKLDHNKIKEMYIDQHMRAEDIAKHFGVSCKTILRRLREAGVKIRKRGYGYLVRPEVIYNNDQLDFFDGLMLGDGSLYRPKKCRGDKNVILSCGFKYEEFADYINKKLDLSVNVYFKKHVSDRYKNGYCEQYGLVSHPNIFFNKQLVRWYPNRKKIIPNDFRFSSISMSIMYLCDGYITNRGKRRVVFFSTQSFNKNNLYIILDGLSDVGIKSSITSDNQIRISGYNTHDFLNYIGRCPVKCYEYKWKKTKG